MSFHVSTSLVSPHMAFRGSIDFKPRIWGDLFVSSGPNNFGKKKNSMSVQVSASPDSSQKVICGDISLSFGANYDMEMDEECRYKEEVRMMIMAGNVDLSEKLCFIDAIQRLGVSYHFEKEIDQVLQNVLHLNGEYSEADLHTVSLRFRLLRQQGHFVTCDVFEKFKDGEGKFKECLTGDVRGMLSLYEATHLRVYGEEVLAEALTFTTTHLQSLIASSTSNPSLAHQISHALKHPLHKSLARLEARHYMPIYEQDASRNELLLTFAKLDFNRLEKVHQKELSDITRWCEDLDLGTKLPCATNRLVDCYFCMSGIYNEPQYALARSILTKVVALPSIIDDIYDFYGTTEELELFTNAIERWDVASLEHLPEYMQLCYATLLDVYGEMVENLALHGKSNCIVSAKQAMTNLVKVYFQEAKWFHQNYTPTMEEYLSDALVTSGYAMLETTSLMGVGEIITKNSFEWLPTDHKIVAASPVVGRLIDDIASHKFEEKRGYVASSTNSWSTEERMSDSWKDINRACLRSTEPLLMTRVLNHTRVINMLYKNEGISTQVLV